MDQQVRKKKHTLEGCIESALKYNRRIDWKRGAYGMYQAAFKYGWADQCTAHMKKTTHRKHTMESCKKTALKYATRGEWKKNDNSSYVIAHRNGWISECADHMPAYAGRKRRVNK